jgi:hypothetical protein
VMLEQAAQPPPIQGVVVDEDDTGALGPLR